MGLWGVVKKAINSDLTVPLNVKIEQNFDLLQKIYNNMGLRQNLNFGTAVDFLNMLFGIYTSGATATISETNLYLKAQGSGSIREARIFTMQAFDLTNIATVEIDWANTAASSAGNNYTYLIASTVQNEGYEEYNARISKLHSFSRTTETMDVSGLSGNHYIRVHATDQTTGSSYNCEPYVYSIKLKNSGGSVVKTIFPHPNVDIDNDFVSLTSGETEFVFYTELQSPADRTQWDKIAYEAAVNEGNITVGLVDSNFNDIAGFTDLEDNADISEVTQDQIRAKVTLTRPTVGDESPIFYSIAFRYIT